MVTAVGARQQDAAAVPAAAKGTRGKSRQPNYRYPKDGPVAVIGLDLDFSGNPLMLRRAETHFTAAFNLRRALQHDEQPLIAAYWNALPTHKGKPSELLAAMGLSRDGFEARAKQHVEASKWLGLHLSKASALHITDEVAQACHRHLFKDETGRRFGRPTVGRWYEYTHVPGRARSHTTDRKWETYRIVGSLTGHLRAYGTVGTVAEALTLPAGASVFRQPSGPMPTPQRPAGRSGWWAYDGPLAMVYARPDGREVVAPIRLPQGAGQFPRLAHFLADPTVWHKVDLNRVQDSKAPGGWRYAAHLLVHKPGWTGPTTQALRDAAPQGRLAGIDGNVSNLSVVSIPDPKWTGPAAAQGPRELVASRLVVSDTERASALRAEKKARDRRKALDRSRRAANPDQYELSSRQRKRAAQRAAAGLPPVQVDVPKGPRTANAAGVPTRAYRRDELSQSYRRTRAADAADRRSRSQAKQARARLAALALIAVHGASIVTERNNVCAWARLWGKGIALFSPGMLLAAIGREAATHTSGAMLRASEYHTALSQHCVCGRRARKTLSERDHGCPDCGLEADRDLLAAALAACVTLTTPNDPNTARLDWTLVQTLATYLEGQQEGLLRSTATPIRGQGGQPPSVTTGRTHRRPAHPQHAPRRSRGRHTPGDQRNPLRVNS